MLLKIFREPPIDNNNYLLIEPKSKEAVLIDCSAVDPGVRDELEKSGAKLKYILLTHGHFDHIAGIRKDYFADRTAPTGISKAQAELSQNSAVLPRGEESLKVVMHESDLKILNQSNLYLPAFGIPEITIPKVDIFVKDNDILKLGDVEIKVIHTPGHTQGGVCYYLEKENMLFSGDTIFRESVGRCDLEGGDFRQIVESIKTKIFTLPNNTMIYPGHGKSTDVAWEKEHNQFM